MRVLKNRLQIALTRMRQKQRDEQKEIERKLAMTKGTDEKPAPIYCKTCKLVFHTKRKDHNESKMHKSISKFLSPKCLICSTQYFSPMAYEKHQATVQHIKVIFLKSNL